VHEADEPNALFDLFDADGLAGEDQAEIDFAVIEANPAAGCDGDGLVVEWVLQRWQALIAQSGGILNER
jgi:hypothetical protein